MGVSHEEKKKTGYKGKTQSVTHFKEKHVARGTSMRGKTAFLKVYAFVSDGDEEIECIEN